MGIWGAYLHVALKMLKFAQMQTDQCISDAKICSNVNVIEFAVAESSTSPVQVMLLVIYLLAPSHLLRRDQIWHSL